MGMMMERKIEKGAGAGAQLRMRRSVRALASANVVATVAVEDLVVGRIVAVGAGVEVARRGDGAGVVTGGGEVAAERIVGAVAGVEAETGETGAGTEGWRRDWEVLLVGGEEEIGRRADPPRVLPEAWEMSTASFTSGMYDLPALNSHLHLRRGMAGLSSVCNSVRE